MKLFRAFICWLLVATQAFAGITYSGTTGQTLYARVQTGTSTYVACALTEGSSGGVGNYTATDAALVSAGLSSSGGPFSYNYRIFSGSPSTTAADTLKGYSLSPLNWLNGTEIPTGNTFGPRTFYVDPSSGSNSNSGLTRSAAFATGAAAITAASAGDTIHWIGQETLSGTLTVNKSLTLEADNWSCGVTYSSADGIGVLTLTADSITLRNIRVNNTGANAQGVVSNGVNNLTIDHAYITGAGDGLFTNLFTVGNSLNISYSKFTSGWDGAILGRWRNGSVRYNHFYTDGSNANNGSPISFYHCCSVSGATEAVSNLELVGNTFEGVVNSGSNVNNSTTVSGLTISERVLCSGSGNIAFLTASKTSWTGTLAGFDSNADDSNGSPLLSMDKYKVRVISTAGTPTKYDFWSRNLGNSGSSTKGIVELGQGQTTDGTTAQFSDLTGTYIRGIMQPSIPLRKLVVDANGLGDATVVKMGPSGSATAQTAADAGSAATRTLLAIPAVAAAANGGLPTVNGSNQVAGVANIVAQTADVAAVNTKLGTPAHSTIAGDIANVSGGGSGGTVSPVLVGDDDTWGFDDYTQVTSPKILVEKKSAALLKQVDLSRPLTDHGSIDHITSVAVAAISAKTAPTIGSYSLSLDKKKILIPIDASAASSATWTITVKGVSTDSREIDRDVQLTIQ